MPMSGPKPVNKYYQKCRDNYPDKPKEYCARVAWNIYCAYKNPNHPGCTEYGKDWGKPYSSPAAASMKTGTSYYFEVYPGGKITGEIVIETDKKPDKNGLVLLSEDDYNYASNATRRLRGAKNYYEDYDHVSDKGWVVLFPAKKFRFDSKPVLDKLKSASIRVVSNKFRLLGRLLLSGKKRCCR